MKVIKYLILIAAMASPALAWVGAGFLLCYAMLYWPPNGNTLLTALYCVVGIFLMLVGRWLINSDFIERVADATATRLSLFQE